MQIEHIGLWVTNIIKMKQFYEHYFQATAGELYHNPKTGFHSYFLSFKEGARLELMTRPDVTAQTPHANYLGFAHLAIKLANEDAVDVLVAQLTAAGYPLLNGPRVTGDGYYEAVIADPEGNLLEITC